MPHNDGGAKKTESKDDNNAVGGGKKMRKSSRPGNMLRQGAGQAIKNLSSVKTGQPDSPCQCQEMNSLPYKSICSNNTIEAITLN